MDKEQWKEGDKVYGLSKIKAIKIKIKKEKAAAEKPAEGAAPAAAAAPAAGAKAAAGAKPAAAAPAKK
jgi:hypothetical protein